MLSQRHPGWLYWTKAFQQTLTEQGILVLVFSAGCFGIYYAKALLSIYAGVFFSVALLAAVFHKNELAEIRRYPGLIALMLIPLVYVLSGLHSEDLGRWWKLVWENLPYATLPLGFYAYRRVPGITWKLLAGIFVCVSAFSALAVMTDYVMHFAEYTALYKVGQTIPTPIIHVRYSFFIALAASLSLALWYEQKRRGEKQVLFLLTGIFLAIVVHVLAVRTGILSFYGGLFGMIGVMIIRDRHWKSGLIAAAGAVVLITTAYFTFPSVANKIGYVMYDLRMMKDHGAQAEYSDNVRITSIRHGLSLLKESLITGTGIGDLKAEMEKMYAERTPNFPVESRFQPISQFVFTFTAFGILGGTLFYLLLLYPLFRSGFSTLMVAIYATTFFSFLGETSIELQHGKMVFVSLVCIAVLQHKSADLQTSKKTG
jgi:O-antigen ligase